MNFSFDTDAKKVTAFRFQYTVGRKQCPVCGQQKGFILEPGKRGIPPWGYCFRCRASGTLRYLETGDDCKMKTHLVLQGLMCRANKEFVNTGGNTALRGILGIPFRSSDPIRQFYDSFMGCGPMRVLQMTRAALQIRCPGADKPFWAEQGLLLPIQSWPGRISGFFCITESGTRHLNLRKDDGVLILRLRPTERHKHYTSLKDACREGQIYHSLDIDINITCAPVL
jgi:hypothetical protein